MTIPEDRPTLDERYARALESSDLAIKPEQRGDADYLVAAGWVHDSLGTALFRLRSEWDLTRATLRQAEEAAREGANDARTLTRRATAAAARASGASPRQAEALKDAADKALDRAERTRDATERAALTARALALVHLKTLSSARQALHVYAIAFGARSRFYDIESVRVITGRALQLWLDPNCPHCEGRGFVQALGEPLRWCQECVRTGKRINGNPGFRLAKSEVGHQFGRALLCEMDRKAEAVMKSMKSNLDTRRAGNEEWGPAKEQELKDRLRELRSDDAQAD